MGSVEHGQVLEAPKQRFADKLKKNLFGSIKDTAITFVLGSLACVILYLAIDWVLLSAVAPWGLADSCQDAQGACWPFLVEKHRLILFGTYPYEEHWRPLLASIILLSAVGLTMTTMFRNTKLVGLWLLAGIVFFFLMRGSNILGLEYVQPERWNGLPVLLMLSIFGLAFAFPLGVLLSLARHQDQLPAIKAFAVTYIEFICGVPMIMVLFLGLFVLPLMMPEGLTLSPLLTTMIALVFFHSAYFAESVRGGLQSVEKGQYEAADTLGLNYALKTRLIILPQALQKSMPGIMNTVLGAYKDTSLVVIIGIHDIMATAKMAFSDPIWQQYGLEAYVFVGAWYLTTCWCLSSYSRRLEKNTF